MSDVTATVQDRGQRVEDVEETRDEKYLTFAIGAAEYGIAIDHVIEIIGIQRITELPGAPDFIRGVINLRGKVIPVIDVRRRFGLQEKAYSDRTCIVVIKLSEMLIGLIVDGVSEVVDIAETEIDPPPKINKGPGSRFIQGFGKAENKIKILLDIHKLLFDNEIEELQVALEE